MIILDESLLGLWNLQINSSSNYLAGLSKIDDTHYQMDWRVRYYVDEKNHDSRDIKNWYRGIIECATAADAIEKARIHFRLLSEQAAGEGWELLRGNETLAEFAHKLSAQSNMHTRMETP